MTINVYFLLQTLCFHLGFVHAYIWDYKSKHERWSSSEETESIAKEIYDELMRDNGALQYSHKVTSLNH